MFPFLFLVVDGKQSTSATSSVAAIVHHEPLEVFVYAPADGGTWHIRQYSRFVTSKEAFISIIVIHNLGGIPKTFCVSNSRVIARSSGLQ